VPLASQQVAKLLESLAAHLVVPRASMRRYLRGGPLLEMGGDRQTSRWCQSTQNPCKCEKRQNTQEVVILHETFGCIAFTRAIRGTGENLLLIGGLNGHLCIRQRTQTVTLEQALATGLDFTVAIRHW